MKKIMVSGGFDPIHVGHVRCIKGTVQRARNKDIHPWEMKGLVVIVVNADSFLIRKKGYAFMPVDERMEIIDSMDGEVTTVNYSELFKLIERARL